MFDPTAFLDDQLQEIERKSHVIVGMGDNSPPLSTGNLALDFVTGGLRPGWYTNAGGEQSAKTTSAISTAVSAAKQGVPIIYFFDYEGSTGNSQEYVANIASQVYGKKMSVDALFGRRDEATGAWQTKPIIRYIPESVGERFFDMLKRTIDALPDKIYLDKKWYYVYEDNKANAKYKAHEVPGMAKKYGKGIYIEAKDGSLQAVFLTDSYPAMNPESNDDEEADRSLALVARMFSKHIPRVKGSLVRKRIMVLGMNQIREKPMVMYGPTQDEPGGQALKFYSDCRVWHTSRALSAAEKFKPVGKGQIEKERCVTGDGEDTYRYVHLRGKKNKMGQPNLEAFLRIWVEDSSGVARGLDPVFDTVWYLNTTGQLRMRGRKTMRLNLGKWGETSTFTWRDMKRWVLGNKKQKKAVCEKIGLKKAIDIRSYCFSQIRSREAWDLYANTNRGKVKKEEDDD